MHLQPIDRENLSARVYRQLRAVLMSGEYEPGYRISITDLAAETGTSATPVREAIFRLVADGALEMQEAQSIRVPLLTAEQIAEIQTIRIWLEGEAAALAAARATSGQIAEVTAINDAFVAATHENDLHRASELNREFHLTIVRFAEMPLLLTTVEDMWARMGAHIRQVNLSLARHGGPRADHGHFGVIRALHEKDGRLARRSIEKDIKFGRLVTGDRVAAVSSANNPRMAKNDPL